MANRFPLILDTSDGNQFKELPDGDNLLLTNSSIVDALDIDARGTVSTQRLLINGVEFTNSFNDLVDVPVIPTEILDLVQDGLDGQVLTTNGNGTVAFQSIPLQDPVLGGALSGTASNAAIKNNTIGIAQLDVDDGAIGQVLATDGSGNLQFVTLSGTGGEGGASSFLELSGEIAYSQIPDDFIDIQKLAVTDGTDGQYLATDGNGTLSFRDIPEVVIDYNELENLPDIPAVLTDLNIADGTAGQYLIANGNGTFGFSTLNRIEGIQFFGTTIRTANANNNLTLDPQGTGYLSITGTNGVLLPKGTTAQRALNIAGVIRYNTELGLFEGNVDGSNWVGLAGVRDVDGDTYISAETTSGSDEDTLKFYTGGLNAATLTNNRLEFDNAIDVKIKSTSPAVDFETGALSVDGGVSIKGNLVVSGAITVNEEFQNSRSTEATATTNTLTNVLTMSPQNAAFFRVGQKIKIFGASSDTTAQTQTGLTVSVAPLGFVEAVPGTGLIYSYRVAQMDITSGKISAATDPVELELPLDSLTNFNNDNNIQLVVSRENSSKAILIYRKVGSEVDYKLIKVLGPKELSTNTSNISWIDFYDYDLAPWSKKDITNAFVESSGVVHIPVTHTTESKLGWFDAVVASVNTDNGTITTTDSFFSEATVTVYPDDTDDVQLLIDQAKTQNKNVVNLVDKNYFIRSLDIPSNITVYGSGDQTRITKFPWSADLGDGNNHIFKLAEDETDPQNISFRNLRIDGNAQSQYLSQDISDPSLNYIINLHGKDILFDGVEITNAIGGGVWLYNDVYSEDISILNCEITDSGLTYFYEYSPLNISESRSIKIAHNTFRNFTDSVDISAVSKGVVSPNIIDNCGSGLLAFGASNIILTPNIILGPAGEFIPNPDVLNSEFDAINITLEQGVDFNSPQYVYQENGELFDFTANQIVLTGLINELIKVNGVEEISTDYSTTLSGTEYIQFTNPGDASGGFAFRITANRVNDLLARAGYSTLFAQNTNTQGLVYRIVCTEYTPLSTIIAQATQTPGGTYNVPVDSTDGYVVGSVVRLVSHSTTPSTNGVDGIITGINTLTNTLSIDFGDSFGDISVVGSSGTVSLQNNFVVAKGKIN